MTAGTMDLRRLDGLEGWPLILARLAWAAVALLSVTVSVVGFRALSRLGTSDIVSARGMVAIPGEVLDTLQAIGLSTAAITSFFVAFRVLSLLVFGITGLVIFMLKSDGPVTLLVSAMLMVLGAALFAPLDAVTRAHPDMTPLVSLVGLAAPPWTEFFRSLAGIGLLLAMYLIPDGRFVPAWTKWVAGLVVTLAGFWWIFPDSIFDATSWPISLQAVWTVGIPATGVYAQLYRYAISDEEHRRRTRLVVFSLTGAMAALVLLTVFSPELGGGMFDLGLVTPEAVAGYEILLLVVLGAALLLFPLSIAVSVWRYRLWDVDVIVNRALVYALLTGLIAAVGLAAVFVLGQVLGGLLGEVVATPVALVGSTVLLTLLFQPARRRVQAVIDRAFYRRKYDAARTVERFSAQLRHQVELDELASDLVAVVHQTVQPRHVSLWLRADGRAGHTEAARSRAQADQA